MFEPRGYLYAENGVCHLHLHEIPAEEFVELPGAQELVKSYDTRTPPFLTKELIAHHGKKDILITFYCDDLDGIRQCQSRLNRSVSQKGKPLLEHVGSVGLTGDVKMDGKAKTSGARRNTRKGANSSNN